MLIGVQPHLFEHCAELPSSLGLFHVMDRTERHGSSSSPFLARNINVEPPMPHVSLAYNVTALAGSEGHTLSSFPIRRCVRNYFTSFLVGEIEKPTPTRSEDPRGEPEFIAFLPLLDFRIELHLHFSRMNWSISLRFP